MVLRRQLLWMWAVVLWGGARGMRVSLLPFLPVLVRRVMRQHADLLRGQLSVMSISGSHLPGEIPTPVDCRRVLPVLIAQCL